METTPPIYIILEYYKKAVTFLLGPLEPALRAIVAYGNWLFDIRLMLEPHWKHVLIPVWLYFAADAKVIWGKRRQFSALFSAFWGGLTALTCAIAVGITPIDEASILPLLCSLGAFIIYDLTMSAWDATFHRYPQYTWWQTFSYYGVRFPVADAVIGAAIVGIVLFVSRFGYSMPSVASLILLLMALAIRNLVVSARAAALSTQVQEEPRALLERGFPAQAADRTWSEIFNAMGTTQMGLYILQAIAGAFLFIASNAGLQLIGL